MALVLGNELWKYTVSGHHPSLESSQAKRLDNTKFIVVNFVILLFRNRLLFHSLSVSDGNRTPTIGDAWYGVTQTDYHACYISIHQKRNILLQKKST